MSKYGSKKAKNKTAAIIAFIIAGSAVVLVGAIVALSFLGIVDIPGLSSLLGKNETDESSSVIFEDSSDSAADNRDNADSIDGDADVITTKYFSITLPDEWKDKYAYEIHDAYGKEYSLCLYEKNTYDYELTNFGLGGGLIFNFSVLPASATADDIDFGNYKILKKFTVNGTSDEYLLIVYYATGQEARDEFTDTYNYLESFDKQIIDSVKFINCTASDYQPAGNGNMAAAYGAILDDCEKKKEYETDVTRYALYDIDKNGTPELIVVPKYYGLSDCIIYTFDGTKAVELGRTTCGYHSNFYTSDKQNYLLRYEVAQGYGTIFKITVENGKLVESTYVAEQFYDTKLPSELKSLATIEMTESYDRSPLL